jgi:DNA-binding NarL/FixJ family response regulator
MAADTIRVVVTDEHAFVRTSLGSMLGFQSRLTVVAEATDGWEAIAMVEKHRPDVVIVNPITFEIRVCKDEFDAILAREQDIRTACYSSAGRRRGQFLLKFLVCECL